MILNENQKEIQMPAKLRLPIGSLMRTKLEKLDD
jgi:hypothetical protein